MRMEEVLTLFGYSEWVNGKILAAARQLSPVQFLAAAPISQSSLRGALVHAYAVEVLYRQRCQAGVSPSTLIPETAFNGLASLEAAWQQEREAMTAYLQCLRDEDLDTDIPYHSIAGEPRRHKLWQLLVQVVNHGTQTYAEAAVILSGYGFSPGNIDFIYYI